jgi:hypothetical protein
MAKSTAQIPVVKTVRLDKMTLSEIEAKGLQHLLVQKRKIKRQVGRPRVIPDRRFQFSMSYWYGLIAADYHSLPRYQRARIAVECWKALLARMKSIPSDPNESKMNAEEAMRMLGKLEGKGPEEPEGEKGSDQQPEPATAPDQAGPEPADQADPGPTAA